MEKKAIRYKWVLYIALMFIVMILETTLLSKIEVFGATPIHLLPYTVAVIAMIEGVNSAALAGLFAGVISDCLLPIPDGFYTIIFVLCGILISFLCTLVFWRTYWTTLLYLLVSIFAIRFVYYVIFFVLFGRAEVLSLFLSIPAEFLASAIFTPIMYFFIVRIARRTGFNEED